MTGQKPLASLVTPVFNEIHTLDDYVEAVIKFIESRTQFDFEIILVDDGSTDGSWNVIEKICSTDERFHGIRLSRNQGAHIAMTAGIDTVSGDVVMTLPCDLQDPIETFDAFIEKWKAGAQIVWGKRIMREDVKWRKAGSWLFNKLLQKFAMPKGSQFTTGSFLLIDKQVVANFRKFREKSRITFAIVAWTGFDQAQVEYERRQRTKGQSGWTLSRMIRTVIDALLAYSTLPLRCIALLGISFFVLSILIMLYLGINWAAGIRTPGWTSTIGMISFFSGIQCLTIGIMGEYLQRIYTEVLQRPLYCISMDTMDNEK